MTDTTIRQPGEPCGETVLLNGKRRRCRYHFDKCYTSKEDLIRMVRPDPQDGSSVPWWFEPGSVEFEILNWSLDAHHCRADYPADQPARFQREQRFHEPTNSFHYGWTPVWACGARREGWSYRHGFGGNVARRRVMNALRAEVQKQIEDVRRGPGDQFHVHHEPPMTFVALAEAFAKAVNIPLEDLPTYHADQNDGCHILLANPSLSESWQVFHAENATLVCMTAEEHRAAHAREEAA